MTIARIAIALVAVATIAGTAHAQSPEAETLFREGKRLIKEGKISEGCDKLEASDRIESSVGTLLNLADCREKNQQLASAWAIFRKAATSAKVANDSKREAEARRRASLLEPKLSYLTISVPDAVEGLSLARNGTLIDRGLWNTAVPVDAGEYDISGQAPGYERWSTRVQVKGDAQKVSVQVPRFKSLSEVTGVDKKPEPTQDPSTEPDATEPVDEPSPSTFTPMRKAAIGLGAAGVAGVALGVVFGLQGKDLAKQADAICPQTDCSDQHGVDLNHDARTKALIANIGFIAGGAAIAGAAVLWFVGAPKQATEHVSIVPTTGGAAVGYAWSF